MTTCEMVMEHSTINKEANIVVIGCATECTEMVHYIMLMGESRIKDNGVRTLCRVRESCTMRTQHDWQHLMTTLASMNQKSTGCTTMVVFLRMISLERECSC